MAHDFLTTTIPYVNAAPHLGFGLEVVQADVLARHLRRRGEGVRFLSGTDDNSLKNVLAAQAAGMDTQRFVDRNAERFAALAGPLQLSFDDFVRTSSDPRHRPAVERLWSACHAAGDLYQKYYEGLYCVGCEQFYTAAELVEGRCPEHGTVPEPTAERNWFFRLSRYQEPLLDLIESGRLRIEPAVRRNEVLAFVRGGLQDLSVSRSRERARGWGIPVPGDPGQVVWVWWDALCNYLSALDYADGGENYRTWWVEASRRVHHLGKGVIRFHAVYWPAMLLSAGLAAPTDILVHDYLTAQGRKFSKSGGHAADPVHLAARYGSDAVRWWLLREVPRVGDADFTEERLAARRNADLVGGLGNLLRRTVTMVHRYRDGVVPEPAGPAPEPVRRLAEVCAGVPGRIDSALTGFDLRAATAVLWEIVEETNRCIEATAPWALARRDERGPGSELDVVLAGLVAAVQTLGRELEPFLPEGARRLQEACTPVDRILPPPVLLYERS